MTENTTRETQEKGRKDVLDEGLTLVREVLGRLYEAGLLSGYAAVVEPHPAVDKETGAMIVSCCAGHAAQCLHPRITDQSDDQELKAAVTALESRELLSMFRDFLPEMPEAGPVERAQDATDEIRETDAGFDLNRDPYNWTYDMGDGTGMYL